MFFFYVAGGTTHVSHKQEVCSENHSYKITRKENVSQKNIMMVCVQRHNNGICNIQK
jgi:hypothetical protein